MDKCEVCVNAFNNNCKKVNCSCEYKCCVKCAKKYFTQIDEMKCMNCKTEWNRTFLVKNFGKTFINREYKIYRENMLFKIEERMFPATQPYIEKENKLYELNKLITQKTQDENNIYNAIHIVQIEENNKLHEEIIKLRQQTDNIISKRLKNENKKLNQVKIDLKDLRERYNELDKIKMNENNFILPTNIKCRNNNCNGNLDIDFHCNLCGIDSCNICFEIKKIDHICDKEKLETIEYVKKHLKVKPCPICNIDISLTEGCNDMFCSICKTTFNFNTLKVTKGNTNEEYKKYVKELKQESIYNDTICPSELDDNYNIMLYNKTDKIFNENNVNIEFNNIINSIKAYFFSIIEIKRDIHKYTNLREQFNRTFWLRKSYMNKRISKTYFKTQIQKIDKDYSKRQEIGEILETYIECASDKLNWFIIEYTQNYKQLEEYILDLKTFFCEINNLITITNNAFLEISNVYNCKIYRIHEESYVLI